MAIEFLDLAEYFFFVMPAKIIKLVLKYFDLLMLGVDSLYHSGHIFTCCILHNLMSPFA